MGLIGGSIGLGLLDSAFAESVIGYDPDPVSLSTAVSHRCVSIATGSLDDVSLADMVVLASPPETIPQLLRDLEPIIGPQTVITDTCSVKGVIMDAVPESLRSRFVGGHPMAGRELGGVKYSRKDLFDGSSWILCPFPETDQDAYLWVQRMVYALDARPVRLSPKEHDEHVALLSHLPHVLANELLAMASELRKPDIHGGSWSDLTRVGGSNPALWEQIFSMNSEALQGTLGTLIERLEAAKKMLAEGNTAGLREIIEKAETARYRAVTPQLHQVNSE